MVASHLAMLAFAIVARVWLWLDSKSFARARTFFAFENRISRTSFLLVMFAIMDADQWRALALKAPRAGSPAAAAAAAAAAASGPAAAAEAARAAVARGLLFVAILWATHTVLFPVKFVHGAPLQLAACLAACVAARGFACMVHADAALRGGAARLCLGTEKLKAHALALAGLAPARGSAAAAALCAARPADGLLVLANALSCCVGVRAARPAGAGRYIVIAFRCRCHAALIAPPHDPHTDHSLSTQSPTLTLTPMAQVWALYERELGLKQRWLRAKAGGGGQGCGGQTSGGADADSAAVMSPASCAAAVAAAPPPLAMRLAAFGAATALGCAVASEVGAAALGLRGCAAQ